MIALIPVAGYATRLYPLTLDKPKALLEIGGRPMMDYVVDKIIELNNITKIVVVSNHKFASQFREWAKKRQQTVSIPIVVLDDGTTSNETRLGAIGDAQFVIETENINEDIAWVSGDNLFSFSIKPFQDFFTKKKSDVIACYDVKTSDQAKLFGIVNLDSNGKVTQFIEKPVKPTSTLASIGIYFYSKETVKLFRKYLSLGLSPDKPGEFVQWLFKEKSVYGFVYGSATDEWFDIGSIETLEAVRRRFK
ncbi:MAG: nucleotidyltransferase family protein [Candidatus Diapherotrites archaeon]|uniref:Nucleotidyltransferase family protein n=1 Tax=Candidatus Iainarchaeum sp. TaxID=3101447 RepID=A0A8T4L696_9ARCH|nr:nucleotidyltransferase family protein [Candidatus Diapherotrites archaeon]